MTEDNRLKQLVVYVAQAFKQKCVGLTADSRAAVNANIGRRAKKHFLLSLLRPNDDRFVIRFFRLFSHVRHPPPNLAQAGRFELAAEQKPVCRLSSPQLISCH